MRTRIYRLSEKHTQMNELFNIAKIEKGLFGFIIYYIKIPQMGIFLFCQNKTVKKLKSLTEKLNF